MKGKYAAVKAAERLERAKVYLLFGGQFGSEGKGKAASWCANELKPDVAVCAFSANAGHVSYSPEGQKFVTHTLPQAASVSSVRRVYIGSGAAINLDRLFDEMQQLGRGADEVKVDHRAVVIQPSQVEAEKATMVRISSTCQGVGQAYADRALRKPGVVLAHDVGLLRPMLVDVKQELRQVYSEGGKVQIEGCQGYELDLLHGFSYPYCTSRSTGAMAVANDCGFPLDLVDFVMAVCRTFPIRVGNVYDKEGQLVGFSGDTHPDSEEVTWDEVTALSGSPEPLLERTTVTQKVRRIFTWSGMSFDTMTWMNGVSGVWLNFADYLDWNIHGKGGSIEEGLKSEAVHRFVQDNLGGKLLALGTGPEHRDVFYGG